MPQPSHRPARSRRGTRGRRRRVRSGELRLDPGLNPAERELLGCFCAPAAALLALGAGPSREALAAARLGYRVTAVELGKAAGAPRRGPHDGPWIEWLRAEGATLPVSSNRYDGALIALPVWERTLTREARVALLCEAARAVRSGGHVIVSLRNADGRPGWRRWLWSYALQRAGGAPAWRRLESGALGDRSAAPQAAFPPAALVREAAAAGLRVAAQLPWPSPPPGALGALARRSAAFWHVAFEVL